MAFSTISGPIEWMALPTANSSSFMLENLYESLSSARSLRQDIMKPLHAAPATYIKFNTDTIQLQNYNPLPHPPHNSSILKKVQ
jgi:hypothetical protein